MNGHPAKDTGIEKFADMDEIYVEPQQEKYLAKVRLSFRLVTLAAELMRHGSTSALWPCPICNISRR
jgi:hypothetical protein